MSADDQMNMILEDRTRVNRVGAFFYCMGETACDGAGLNSGEQNGRVFERLLRLEPLVPIVSNVRDRLSGVDFRRLSETKQLPRGDEIGPGPTRVVGKPETVDGENDVGGEDFDGHSRVEVIELSRFCRATQDRMMLVQREDVMKSSSPAGAGFLIA